MRDRNDRVIELYGDAPLDGKSSGYRRASASRAASSAAVAEPGASPSLVIPLHVHNPRLCPTCMAVRLEQLRTAPRARVNAEAVAAEIRRDRGGVWSAVLRFGISYEHALRIRRGWRGAGRRSDAIPFRSRGWSEYGQNGRGPLDMPWDPELDGERPTLRLVHVSRHIEHRAVVGRLA